MKMDQTGVIILVILIAIMLTSFNIFTLIVILTSRSLRKRPSSLPTVNFLLASAIQGLIPAPLYVYRKIIPVDEYWACDVYRFFYLFCGHSMQFSILLVSLDRMVAIKFPFRYESTTIKPIMIRAILALWIVTLVVDIIPFLTNMDGAVKKEKCHFQPSRFWGLSVIVFYNIVPFVFLVANYIIIWSVAAKFASDDKLRAKSLYRATANDVDSNDDEKKAFAQPQQQQQHKTSYGALKANVSKTLKTFQFYLEIKATKTSLVLVAVYLLCWGPLSAFYIIDHFFDGYYSKGKRNQTVRMVIKLINFCSSLLVPLCYCWLNHDYRITARNFIQRCCLFSSSKRRRGDNYLDENTNDLDKTINTTETAA